MAQIVLGKNAMKNVDGANTAAIFNFMAKLQSGINTPGLRIKRLSNMADKRVRTARVNDDMRAVLFELEGGDEPVYLLHGVWPHDEGNRIAQNLRGDLNPTNGQFTTWVEEPPVATDPEVNGEWADVDEPLGYIDGSDLSYSWLASYGYTAENLEEFFGLPTDVARRAITKDSPEKLWSFAEQCLGWIQEVLLALAAGDSKDKIVDSMALLAPAVGAGDGELEPAADSGGASDEQIIEALKTDLGQSEYTFVDGEDELRAIIESGSFGQWRKFLHPQQRRYVSISTSGPFRLSGAAGTGKTVVLLHRAKHLAHQNPDAKIILTTFGRTLAEGLEDQLQFLDPSISLVDMGESGVHVAGVDALAYRALVNARNAGNGRRLDKAMNDVLGSVRSNLNDRRGPDWASVVGAAGLDLSLPIMDPDFLAAEYEEVILPRKIRTEREYLRVRRAGRGVGLNRNQRRQVWQAVEAYRAEAGVTGGLTYAEVAAVAAQLMVLRIDEGDPHYADHLLVDEGQDLSAVQWQFLRGLVGHHEDDMFIAEDSQQRIYGRQLVLSHFGIKITGRSRRLTLNYRTTEQNLRRAMRALEGVTYVELEGEEVEDSAYRSVRQGPPPVEIQAESVDQAIAHVVDHVAKWVEDQKQESGQEGSGGGAGHQFTYGVLARNRKTAERINEALADKGLSSKVITRDSAASLATSSGSTEPVVSVMTMHRAKGLEFTHVAMLTEPALDRSNSFEPEGAALDRELMERSLRYVGMTRARDQLLVVERK